MVAFFVNIDKQKNQKRKCISWFLNYLQAAFLKTTQPSQCDAVPWQNEAIANWNHCKAMLLFFIFNSLAINTITTIFWICTGNITLSLVGTWTTSIIPSTDPKNSYYCIITKLSSSIVEQLLKKTVKMKEKKYIRTQTGVWFLYLSISGKENFKTKKYRYRNNW